MIRKFISYYKPHKLLFTLDMTASFFVAVIAIFYPILTRHMLNDFIPNARLNYIIISAAALLCLYILRMLLKYFIQYYGHMMGAYMQAQMRRDMFNHLQRLPYSYYDNQETGEIMARMTNDLFDISELAHHGPENLLISSISIIISFCYLTTINVPLTLIIFACIPFMVVICTMLRRRMKLAFTRNKEALAQINASMETSISGIRVTKAYTNASKERDKFEVGNKAFVESKRDAYKAMGIFHSSTTFITDVFNVIILLAGGYFLYCGKISFADYSAFVVSVNLFITPTTTLIDFMEQYQNGITGFIRFQEILSEEPEVDPPGAVDAGVLKGDIQITDLKYSYNDEESVLNGITMHINPGETFALVGPSGGGKTTICHLIPRFYNLTSGSITIDGTDIRQMTMESLRRNIGIVQQDIYLFNASFRENILYGRLDASEEEIIAAAKQANIHDYIMSLPRGYDTIIGERGIRLSGGQKQRLSIARVFLKNPPILILDEATSALDNTTEILIQQALDDLSRGRTVLVVAHRLSTIKNANEIAVISHGRILEQGTHEELMARGQTYADLYNLQFRE